MVVSGDGCRYPFQTLLASWPAPTELDIVGNKRVEFSDIDACEAPGQCQKKLGVSGLAANLSA